MVLALIASVIYYTTYFDDGSTIEANIEAAQGSLSAETARRNEIEKIMKREEEMRGNLLQLERNLEVVKSKIPNELPVSVMSSILNTAATECSILVEEIESTPSNNEDQSPAPTNLANGAIRPEDLVQEVSFTVKLSGTFGNFVKFFEVLTKEDKIIKIKDFSMDKNSNLVDDTFVKFSGEIIGYKQAGIGISKTQ